MNRHLRYTVLCLLGLGLLIAKYLLEHHGLTTQRVAYSQNVPK